MVNRYLNGQLFSELFFLFFNCSFKLIFKCGIFLSSICYVKYYRHWKTKITITQIVLLCALEGAEPIGKSSWQGC